MALLASSLPPDVEQPLARWFQPQLLTAQAMAQGRRLLLGDGYLVLENFLIDTVAQRVWNFLDREVEFQEVITIVYPHCRVDAKEWEATPAEDRLERTLSTPRVLPDFRLTENTAAFFGLRSALRSAETEAFLSELCGVELRGDGEAVGYPRKMGDGDFIHEHDDEVRNRALAMIIHLSRDWTSSSGGSLRINTTKGKTAEIDTGWNRAVLMLVDGQLRHAVTDVCGANSRYTIQNWFVRA